MKTLLIATLLALVSTTPAQARKALSPVAEAASLLGKDPARAIKLVEPTLADPVIMSPEKDVRYFCANGPDETLIGLISDVADGKGAVAYTADVCDALFIKGFSLIDLQRGNEAEPFLRRATELAPTNAHYLNEYAEWWKSVQRWQKSHDLFAKAADLAPEQATHVRETRLGRSLRGMGYAKIEMGDLDAAERLMNESLKHDPDSPAAKNELAYIAEQRAKLVKH